MSGIKNDESHRILWLSADLWLPVNEFFAIPVSSALNKESFLKIKEMGYNGVAFGLGNEHKTTADAAILKTLSEELSQRGIYFYVRLSILDTLKKRSPADPEFKKLIAESFAEVQNKISEAKYFLWESQLQHDSYFAHPGAKFSLEYDLVEEELNTIEENLKGDSKLIFFVPCRNEKEAQRQSRWLPSLNFAAGKRTAIAFSSVAGQADHDHCALHPYWQSLHKWEGKPLKTMLPVINGGGISQGEGLWPSISYDLFDLMPRIAHYQMGNPVVLAPAVPAGHGFLHCNLWVLGKLQEQPAYPEILIENWFKTYKPRISLIHSGELLKKIRKIVLEISLLRSMQNEKSCEEPRLLIESILTQLKYLELKLSSGHSDNSALGLDAYFQYFCADARRMVSLAGQNLNLNTPLAKEEPSFWTISKGTKITLLERPANGSPGSLMEKIYLENRI